jgi:hypothetical protein
VLQEDGLGVLWEARKGRQKALFNFQPRRLALPGRVLDVTAGEVLPPGKVYRLKACHTYTFAG